MRFSRLEPSLAPDRHPDLLPHAVWVNNYGLLSNAVPFGGMRQSGIGRELGRQGIYEYCSSKSVLHNIGEELSWPL